jgi:hypothetical protein
MTITTIEKGHSGTARGAGPGIQMVVPAVVPDSGFAPSARSGLTKG